MNNFESGMFTYNDLEQDTRGVDSEQSIARGLTISNEDPTDTPVEEQSVYLGLEESGVLIEPFEPFYADGTAPQVNAR